MFRQPLLTASCSFAPFVEPFNLSSREMSIIHEGCGLAIAAHLTWSGRQVILRTSLST